MNKVVPIGAFDRLLLRVESQQTPAHTASLNIYQLPHGAASDFLHGLYERLRHYPVTAAPFNYVLAGTLKRPLGWRTVEHVDLDYHVRHSALPRPGGERELGILISHLHSNQMDFSRPLWEFHLIEGLEGERFATYLKMHHALADGGAVVRINMSAMTEQPDGPMPPPPWAAECAAPTAASSKKPKAVSSRGAKEDSPGLFRALTRTAVAQITRRTDGLVGPYAAPRCMLNGPLTPSRRYATQSYDIARLKALAKVTGGTINDIILEICSAAIRRYLIELNALPKKSLIGSVPVALERKAEETLGSVVGLITTTLATHIADPKERLMAIMDSSRQAKANLFAMPKWKIDIYNAIVMLPFARGRVSRRAKPVGLMGNVPISNVPGPKRKLYFQGAEVEAMYPCAVIMQGYALNITARSYHHTINLGFLGCRDLLPHFQHLAVYTGEALTELERVYGLGSPQYQHRVAPAERVAQAHSVAHPA
ncbi:MAG TPA: wax ester/triacylglycerol synthase family O-acyltransferase [Steroidobacteraceae bacterium]|nr:wax ester/triacylglycerol synthase family O-acyltransferase [Steroidobacteraceae bacterium]